MSQSSAWEWAVTKTGARLSNLHNIAVAISHDPALQAVVWYDTFLQRLLTGTGREWTDSDDVGIALRLQDEFELTRVTPAQVREVLTYRASQTPRHVVRAWLLSLTWDEIPRIAEAFEDHWGVACDREQPCEYVRAASANFFIGLVARIFSPGCQLDTMPVFEGPQGTWKSSALRVLGGPWYAASHESVTQKDFFQALQGKWLIEIGELDSFTRAEVTRVKTVISTPVDRYRVSYGRTALDFPRQCVFAGTTNASEWGHDETGLRRFWPIRCGAINLRTLTEARVQLFAEACALFHDAATWWEMPTSAGDVQADRQEQHPWTDAVCAYLIGKDEVTIPDILDGPLRLSVPLYTLPIAHTIGRILRLAGWSKVTARRDGKLIKLWRYPES